MSAEVTYEELTPTAQLILELLQARFLTGESSWPFKRSTPTTKALKELNQADLVGFKSSVAGPDWYQVWMTDEGREFMTDPKAKIKAVLKEVLTKAVKNTNNIDDAVKVLLADERLEINLKD